MLTETMTAAEVLKMYRDDVNKLAGYLDWLESKSGKTVSSVYSGDGLAEHSVAFPVYEGTLMSFIKDVDKTVFIDRNYRYVYTRNRLKTHEDELRFIDNATILQMDQLAGIMSNYVIGGRTRGRMWSEGMDAGIFYHIVKKSKELVDFWTNAEVATK